MQRYGLNLTTDKTASKNDGWLCQRSRICQNWSELLHHWLSQWSCFANELSYKFVQWISDDRVQWFVKILAQIFNPAFCIVQDQKLLVLSPLFLFLGNNFTTNLVRHQGILTCLVQLLKMSASKRINISDSLEYISYNKSISSVLSFPTFFNVSQISCSVI